MSAGKLDFGLIVKDNEAAVAQALAGGHFVLAFLLVHTLVESLLRKFLRVESENMAFNALIERYQQFLDREQYPEPEFVDELRKFNQRRNRMVHELWRKGFSVTNKQAEPALQAAVMMYGLFIEWLETFDPEITGHGFEYDQG